MIEGDILRNLLRSHVHHDEAGFVQAAEAIIEQERRLNHRLLADDLQHIISNRHSGKKINGNGSHNDSNASRKEAANLLPVDREKGLPLLQITQPEIPWESLILASEKSQMLRRLVEEHRRSELLRAAGVRPKRTALFYGPPGCGKTFAAGAIGSALGWPLATVRLDAVISSLLGQTATNLRRIFDFMATSPHVVLFDECDTLAKERSSGQDHGELQRVVTALLQLIDTQKHESLLLFASNHEQMMDSALWRRFDLTLEFTPPTEVDRILMMRRFLQAIPHDPKLLEETARVIKGCSGGDVRWFADEVIRSVVLAGRSRAEKLDFETSLAVLKLRIPKRSPTASTKRPQSSNKPKAKAKTSK